MPESDTDQSAYSYQERREELRERYADGPLPPISVLAVEYDVTVSVIRKDLRAIAGDIDA